MTGSDGIRQTARGKAGLYQSLAVLSQTNCLTSLCLFPFLKMEIIIVHLLVGSCELLQVKHSEQSQHEVNTA